MDYMKIAMQEAIKAGLRGDFPVGAVIVANKDIITKDGNRIYSKFNMTAHAETNAINKASKDLISLSDIELYTTLEPCLMCVGTAIMGNITTIVYACSDPFGGASKLDPKTLALYYHNNWPEFVQGEYGYESKELLIGYMERHKANWSEQLKSFRKL